jgi:hypothetical protein
MASKYFIPLRKLLNSILLLDIDKVALDITRTAVAKRLIISLNTEGLPTSQLYQLGEDSTGRSLGEYSPFTVREKRRKGQPTDRVTLKDTGEFYMSFQVIPFRGGFEITADAEKDDKDLRDVYGEDIIGLNDENLQILIEFYRAAIQQKIKENLRAA